MRMRFAVGRSGDGVQYPHGSRQALPILRSRLERPSGRDDRDYRAATLPDPSEVDLAPSRAGHLGDVSRRGRARRSGPRVVGRVLEPLDLADPRALPAYWNFLWCLSPPTYCLSQSSSGSPLKSSTAAEAAAGAVCRFAQSRSKPERGARPQARNTTRPCRDLSVYVKPNPDRQGGDILTTPSQVNLA
jgi:hypothetical protein